MMFFVFYGWMDKSVNHSVLSLAKPVRAGHSCSPTNPFYIRGYSDHPVAFYKADFHNSNMKQEAAPAAPATPESEPRLPEANSKQSSPTKHPHPQVDDSHDNEAQDSDSHDHGPQDSDSHDLRTAVLRTTDLRTAALRTCEQIQLHV